MPSPQQPWWRRWFGRRSERSAEQFLIRKGHRILTRNWTCPVGEIDLVTRQGESLVFVEVRSTSRKDAESAKLSVDQVKQERLTRLASAFMKRYRVQNVLARFDVVVLAWPSGATEPIIEHFENAFPALGTSSMFS
ncbi:MAG TPA: YraN family protein [Gemmatales bacterium]|nr:YraN family protein [Gemmatales bacterium]